MRYLFLILLIASCSAEKHLELAEKHTQKAIEKGAVIKSDTAYTYIYRTDTLIKDGKVVLVPKIDSIPYQVTNTVQVVKHLSRQERKALKDSMDHAEKMYKLETKRLDKLAKRNVSLTKELRKRTNALVKQNIKLAKVEKRGGFNQTLKIIGLLCTIVAVIFLIFREILPK